METQRDSRNPLMKENRTSTENSAPRVRILDEMQEIKGEYFAGKISKDSENIPYVSTCDITDLYDGFNYWYYIEILSYHFLFFFITGPFTPYILRPFTGKHLMANLSFTGRTNSFYYQTTAWLTWVLLLWAYIVYFKDDILFSLQIFILMSSFLVRILSVSVKYGTFSQSKMNKFRTQFIPYEELQREFVLAMWNQQEDSIVETEIRKAMHRQEIDSAIFQINFLGDVEEDIATVLRLNTNYYRERTTSYFPLKEGVSGRIEEDHESYHGFSLILFWIEEYKKHFTLKLRVTLIILTIIRAFLPLIMATIADQSAYSAISSYNTSKFVIWFISQFFSISLNMLSFYFNSALIGVHLKDLRRKVFFMQQLSYLIAPKRFDGFKSVKFFPTMNILDPRNLKSWSSLRRLSMAYGRRIDTRLQFDLVGYLLYYITLLILVFLDAIPFVSFETSNLLRISVIYEISIMIFLAFSALLKAAEINNFFVIHKKILMENRIFYLDLAQKAHYYFETKCEALNYLYKFCIKKINESTFTTLHMKKNYLKKLEDMTSEAMDDLEFSQRTDPFKIFGINASYELLISLGIGLFSIAASTIDSIISKN